MENFLSVEDVARICHEANESFCVTQGDFSQKSWDEAPEWQKESMINGVEFRLNNPNATPEEMHNNWLKKKAEDGWKYGEVKDETQKEHPCFRPYSELPVQQQAKDYLSRGIIQALAPFVNFGLPDKKLPELIRRGPGFTVADLPELFTYHPPKGDKAERYGRISKAAENFARVVLENTPACADQPVTIRKIIDCRMSANSTIALNEKW